MKMRFSSRFVTTAAAVAFTCIASAAAYYYHRRKNEVNEVMIFCKLQMNAYNYYDKLLSFIESARKSVHVCMPSIHSPAIQGRLLDLIIRKNIEVRIIIDCKGYNESTASFLDELMDAGAEIKWKSEEDQHHKFCLVDNELLMTGTLDWGDDLSFDNWNYVYITNRNKLVKPVDKEFSSMWNKTHMKIRPCQNTSKHQGIQEVKQTIVLKEKGLTDVHDSLIDNGGEHDLSIPLYDIVIE